MEHNATPLVFCDDQTAWHITTQHMFIIHCSSFNNPPTAQLHLFMYVFFSKARRRLFFKFIEIHISCLYCRQNTVMSTTIKKSFQIHCSRDIVPDILPYILIFFLKHVNRIITSVFSEFIDSIHIPFISQTVHCPLHNTWKVFKIILILQLKLSVWYSKTLEISNFLIIFFFNKNIFSRLYALRSQ